MAKSLRWLLSATVILGLSVTGARLSRRDSSASETELAVTVRPGDFQVTVTTAGELQAPKFVAITVPEGLQRAQWYQGIKIVSMVPEGTVVQKGDVVADLDRGPVSEKLTDASLAVQKAQAVYELSILDSALNLSKERDNLEVLRATLEEKALAQQQVVYEAPTIQRQAALDLDRAKRGLDQATKDYQIKIKQAEAKLREVGAELEQAKIKRDAIQAIVDQFTIRAPGSGMVTYVRTGEGRRREVGDQVSAWNPVVAKLPDITVMESVTYVNEIDIRKVAVGQRVTIKLDADSTKMLRGRVIDVANAGVQRPNTDAKVFEVHIAVERPDTTLRPGMTTSNTIEVRRMPDALAVPLEALGNEKGVPFLYAKRSGHTVKQEVVPGAISDNEVVILRGVAAGDRVLLSSPKDADRLPWARLPAAVEKAAATS